MHWKQFVDNVFHRMNLFVKKLWSKKVDYFLRMLFHDILHENLLILPFPKAMLQYSIGFSEINIKQRNKKSNQQISKSITESFLPYLIFVNKSEIVEKWWVNVNDLQICLPTTNIINDILHFLNRYFEFKKGKWKIPEQSKRRCLIVS